MRVAVACQSDTKAATQNFFQKISPFFRILNAYILIKVSQPLALFSLRLIFLICHCSLKFLVFCGRLICKKMIHSRLSWWKWITPRDQEKIWSQMELQRPKNQKVKCKIRSGMVCHTWILLPNVQFVSGQLILLNVTIPATNQSQIQEDFVNIFSALKLKSIIFLSLVSKYLITIYTPMYSNKKNYFNFPTILNLEFSFHS